MTDQNAIQSISDLLLSSTLAAGSEPNQFAKLAQKYPYFQPLRYIKAKEQFAQEAFSKQLLTSAYPYIGNWILFSDYLQGVQPEHTNQYTYTEEETSPPVDVTTTPEPVAHPVIAEVTEPVAEPELIEEQVAVDEQPIVTEEPAMETEEVHEEPEEKPIPEEILTQEEPLMATTTATTTEEQLFAPVSSEDYFLQQGIKVSQEIPDSVSDLTPEETDVKDKALMVMMSFKDWLLHFKSSAQKQQEEHDDKKAVKTMWQKEKLAAAMQEENEEIPENVFEMAVNSITNEEGLASESLAEIYLKQQKYDKAVEMYRKLSLRNPEKNAYFAQKIKDILKEKEL